MAISVLCQRTLPILAVRRLACIAHPEKLLRRSPPGVQPCACRIPAGKLDFRLSLGRTNRWAQSCCRIRDQTFARRHGAGSRSSEYSAQPGARLPPCRSLRRRSRRLQNLLHLRSGRFRTGGKRTARRARVRRERLRTLREIAFRIRSTELWLRASPGRPWMQPGNASPISGIPTRFIFRRNLRQ